MSALGSEDHTLRNEDSVLAECSPGEETKAVNHSVR